MREMIEMTVKSRYAEGQTDAFASMSRRIRLIIPWLLAGVWWPLAAFGQIGGTGWSPKAVTFNVQWPYNTNESLRYTLSNNIYHCLVYSNDAPFAQGNTTLPRTEQRFTPDYTNGEIQYQAVLMAPSNENSYCVFQIHTGDAQSSAYGSTTFMLFWFSSDGGSVHDYSGTELVTNLGNKWFQLNVDHNLVTGTIRVWINQNLVWTQQDNGAGDFYFKDGVYEQNHSPTYEMDTWISNSIQMWVSSGTNPPAAPTGLTATPAATQIVLAWNASVGATNYNVMRSTTSGGPYTTIASVTGASYTDTSPVAGTTYYYVVMAVDSFGQSTNSTQASAVLLNTSFQLSVTPSSAVIVAGASNRFTVTMTTNSGFTGIMTLGITGLPAGASASFNPPSLSAAGTSTLTIQTSTNTPGGTDTVTIGGSNGSSTCLTNVTLTLAPYSGSPGTLLWTSGSGTDTHWSTILNWTNASVGGYGPPAIGNTVVFTNMAAVAASAFSAPGSGVVNPANVNNYVNGSFTIAGLTNFANAPNTRPVYHNIGLAGGAMLTVNGAMQVGGFTQWAFGDNSVVNLTVSGAGAALQLTNGGLTVSEDATNGPGNDATLDLSGLDTFTMNGTQIRIGIEGGGNFHHASGVVYLARTNSLVLTTAGYTDPAGTGSPYSGNPALYIGHNASDFGGGSRLYLGVNNSVFADYATIGRGDTNALLAFNPAFLAWNPSVLIRGTNGGSSRVGVYVVGDGSAGAQANNAPSTNDFSGGAVDAMINYLCVGRGRNGNSSGVGASGVLTFDQGTINANVLAVGYIYQSGSNSPASGTVNVNGAATLIVNSNLTLSSQAVGAGGVMTVGQGALNINGGTVHAANIAGGGGLSTINLNSGTLDLQFTNPAPGQIVSVSTLNLGVSAGADPALLANAAAIAASNVMVIAPNGTLAGNTAITSPGLTINGAISPGVNGPGGITNSGAVTLGAGGDCVVTVRDAIAGPAAGWSFLQAGAAINVQATGSNPFIITLQSEGLAANFNDHTNFDWVIATAAGGIANFSSNAFAVDDSLFANDLGGGFFYVRTNGNSLLLSFSNAPPPSAANAMFSQAGLNGGSLVFSGAGGVPGGLFLVLVSTNLALPPDSWQVVSTNAFGGAGGFSFTNALNPNAPGQYYLLKSQTN
jgi:hypothetical protein